MIAFILGKRNTWKHKVTINYNFTLPGQIIFLHYKHFVHLVSYSDLCLSLSKLNSSHCNMPILGNVIVPKNILLAILLRTNPIFHWKTDTLSKKQEKQIQRIRARTPNYGETTWCQTFNQANIKVNTSSLLCWLSFLKTYYFSNSFN